MADLFEEVEEQLRSDRYRTFAFKILPWVLGLAAAVLIAALSWWGWSHYQEQATGKASEQYEAGLEALQQGRADQATKLFTDVSQSQAKAYKSLALMQLGGIQLSQNKTAAAVQFFDKSAEAAPDPMIADAARLKSAFALLDTAPKKDVEARLTPLMQDGRPYRVEAREALAFSKLMGGDHAGARGDFVIISGMLDAPEGARARAKAAIGLIDSGSAKAVATTVRAAAALPPTALAPTEPAQPQAPGPQ
ncbi:tetratricopeptide repeat protein [Phenylobacterium sp. LjRoot225]|uniref:tetratricopeptide repeat protein n=1 Tax=Phenylobacterium sp. LjRoot225 TaxID=3342285 RepID=UPI003ED06A67